MVDPYQALGLKKTASQDDIKRAYRRLAKKYHPDLNPGDKTVEQKFRDLTAAYELLGDADKRARFDKGEIDAAGTERPRERSYWHAHAEAPGAEKYAGFGGRIDPIDLFADLFGRERGAGLKIPGADVLYPLSIDFAEAVLGATRRVQLPDGRTLEVSIPPGTEDGQRLRLKGQGEPGMGGAPAGDAFIEVHVRAHPFFSRKGDDIHLELPITLQEAVLGGRITVPTVDGSVAMNVPKGANTGNTLRLKGKGVPRGKSGARGDQYVTLKVVLPDPADEALTRFVEGWAPAHDYEVRAQLGRRK